METGPTACRPDGCGVFHSSCSPGRTLKPLLDELAWHQIKVTLATEADHRLAEHGLLRAVQTVVEEYRTSIERQQRGVEKALAIRSNRLRRRAGCGYRGGLEMTVRYPVPLEDAGAVDDRVTRALLMP